MAKKKQTFAVKASKPIMRVNSLAMVAKTPPAKPTIR
jgi:hypothetical protein